VKHVSLARSRGSGEKHTCARAFPGIISAWNVFLGGSPHVRFRERRRKGAQMRGQAKWQKNAQTRARARRLRRDIQVGPPRTDLCERKNAQRSRPLQRKGARVWGQARRCECVRCRVPCDGRLLHVLNEKSTWPDIRLAHTHTPKILISRFFIENAEQPAIARHPAAYAFAPLCLPPHACSLPL